MISIVTALMLEAKPIIEHFKLKKDIDIHPYPVYRNSDISLIVSGIGKIKSAMAAVYLLSVYNTTKNDSLLNIGFCGASKTNYDIGSLLLINKVTDMDTKKDYYPDVLININIPQVSLQCFQQTISNNEWDNEFYCDMESTGIMEVANKFIYAHNVVLLKIISDFLQPKNLDNKILKKYITDNMHLIENTINEMKQNNSFIKASTSVDEIAFGIAKNLMFSESMKKMFLKEITKASNKGLDVQKILEPFSNIKANSKTEGKKIFEKINQKLKQKTV